MKYRALAVFVALIVAFAGCGGGDDDKPSSQAARDGAPAESAEDAFRRQLGYASKGQLVRMWDEMHPAQQAVVPRDLFVKCQGEAWSGVDVRDVDVLETFREKVALPGSSLEVDATALTFRITAVVAGRTLSDTDTMHEVAVDGAWRWVASGGDAYAKGECPD
jgi:hypothetical protein